MKRLEADPQKIQILVEKILRQGRYTKTEIAAELGVSVNAIYSWTSGIRQIKKIYLEKLNSMIEKEQGTNQTEGEK